jgi:hypothetical protein
VFPQEIAGQHGCVFFVVVFFVRRNDDEKHAAVLPRNLLGKHKKLKKLKKLKKDCMFSTFHAETSCSCFLHLAGKDKKLKKTQKHACFVALYVGSFSTGHREHMHY